ncbi:conjugal transfer protein TraO [Halomonas elongata]|uniref:conjugal transfer protein TraO n=1 Tax=Halomonas elongata TaxID=2746 RepID=UPI00255A9C9A|nr:conjugal transfer protein TraO [Halomonas elongata]MDL4860782.1 conjugal transfer protein TraO [Halomonas elongata]
MAQDNQAKRNLVLGLSGLGALVLIVYAAWTWIASGTSPAQPESSVSSVGAAGSSGRETDESEYYSSLLEDYNKDNANTARNSDESYLSVLSSREEEAETSSEPAPQPQQNTQPTPVAPTYAYQPPPQRQPQNHQVSDALVNNVQGMMASWAPKPSGIANTVQTEWQQANSRQNSHVRNADHEAGAQSGSVREAQQALNHKIVPDYAVIPAILETNIDTDENSLVTAEVPAGPYAGMRFYASGYQRLENTVDFTFTAMRWQGKTYAVNAKPLDVETKRTALSGDVNSRYFERIVIPALARGVARAGELYEEAAETTVVTGLGTTVQTNDGAVNDREVAGAFVGGLADQTANVLEQDASRVPIKQVLVDGNTTIGIQIIGSITAADEIGPDGQRVDLETISQPAQQPQRPQTFQPMGNSRGRTAGPNVYAPGQGMSQ